MSLVRGCKERNHSRKCTPLPQQTQARAPSYNRLSAAFLRARVVWVQEWLFLKYCPWSATWVYPGEVLLGSLRCCLAAWPQPAQLSFTALFLYYGPCFPGGDFYPDLSHFYSLSHVTSFSFCGYCSSSRWRNVAFLSFLAECPLVIQLSFHAINFKQPFSAQKNPQLLGCQG